jgi:hypothetical protein
MENAGVTRKLAVILAAEVSGYSRLMAGDEKGTLANVAWAFSGRRLGCVRVQATLGPLWSWVVLNNRNAYFVQYATAGGSPRPICSSPRGRGGCGAAAFRRSAPHLASWRMTPSVWRWPERTRLTPCRMLTR